MRPGLVLLLLALALAGCSNDPNPKPLQAARDDGAPWQIRYWGMPDDPRSLDPQFAYEETSRRVLEPIYDCLLEYDPFKTDPYEVVPCLLTAMPERQPGAQGGVDYLCRLKPGVRFHDDPCFPGGKGRELVAADVHYALQRICDPKVECPVFSTLSDYIIGMKEAFEEAKKDGDRFSYAGHLAGFEELDPHTFRLHLSRAYPQIIYWMAMHFMAPVAREAVEYYDGKGGRPDFKWHPVGTGPFAMVNYTPGQRVRLIRNPHYTTTVFPSGGWAPENEARLRPLAGHALPLVDEVQITIFREALPIWLLTRQGYLDGMGVSKDAFNSVVTPQRELTGKYRERGMTLDKDVEPSTFFLSLNMQDPVLGKNKKLRQALCCAFDSQSFIEIFYNGVPTVAQQLIPPGVAGFKKDLRSPYAFDLERGRQLLAEAGYPEGRDPATGHPLELTLDVVATGSDEQQMAQFEQRQFEQLGVKIRVLENNFPRMMEKEDRGAFQIASGSGWMADYPDPENFFFLFYSKNFPPTGKNTSRYQNPDFDAQFERMSSMENSPERLAIIDQMNQELIEDAPVIFTFNKAFYSLVQPWAPRTHHNLMLEGGLKYGTLDSALRARLQREWNPQPVWPVFAGVLLFAGLGTYGVIWNRKRNV